MTNRGRGSVCVVRSAPAIIAAALALLGWASPSMAEGKLRKADYDAVMKDPGNEALFQLFLSKLPRVAYPNGGIYYIIEGDLTRTAQQVRAMLYRRLDDSDSPKPNNGELKVMTVAGQRIFWPKGQRTLSYSIDRASFPNDDVYQTVANNFAAAAKDWVDTCPTCGLSFIHRQDLDLAPNVDATTFIVTFDPNETNFVAAAFFPNDETFKRYVVVAGRYLDTNYDRVGVFRHEIGHILGYRHEHIGGVVGCFTEGKDWEPVTPYDPKSVMHYFCGGGGSMDLSFRQSDRDGHAEVYK